jgi:hypothetical protein
MAVTAITVEKLTTNTIDVDALAQTAATTAADGFLVDVSNVADHTLLFVFNNSNAAATARSATIKKGTGIQGVADLATGDIAAGKNAAIVVESGRFKIMSGTNKGKLLIIPSHAELTMAAIALPKP